jgi:hypothetical protein
MSGQLACVELPGLHEGVGAEHGSSTCREDFFEEERTGRLPVRANGLTDRQRGDAPSLHSGAPNAF